MKGPYENNKVYAIAAHGKAGIAGGVVPAVYAYDTRYDEGRFFTIGRDEAEENPDDVYNASLVGELMLDSGQDAGYRVPERQVLCLWSQRDEALKQHRARSERGKAASATRKKRLAEESMARMREADAASAATAEGRIEAHPAVLSLNRIVRDEKDVVLVSLRMSPARFQKLAAQLGIEPELVEEWLVESVAEGTQLKVGG